MNFSTGVQNISFPGEGPVYIRPVFQKAQVDAVSKVQYNERQQKQFNPEKSEANLNLERENIQRGTLVDLRV